MNVKNIKQFKSDRHFYDYKKHMELTQWPNKRWLFVIHDIVNFLQVENEIKSKMILALNHFKADATTNSNSISNAWNFLFMTVSGVELYIYHLK